MLTRLIPPPTKHLGADLVVITPTIPGRSAFLKRNIESVQQAFGVATSHGYGNRLYGHLVVGDPEELPTQGQALEYALTSLQVHQDACPKWYAVLDDDDYYHPEYLAEMFKAMDKHPHRSKVDCFYSMEEGYGENGATYLLPWIRSCAVWRMSLWKELVDEHGLGYSQDPRCSTADAEFLNAVWVHRDEDKSVFEEVPGARWVYDRSRKEPLDGDRVREE